MLNIKNVLPITLLIFASIGLISFFTVSHIQSLRKLNQNANEVSFSYYDKEAAKRAIEEEIKLSKFHKAMQAHTIRHLSLSELEKEGLEGSNRDFRSLAESNLFDDVAIVNPNKDSFYHMTRWITTKLKQFSSSIVVYPYSYEYSPDDSPNSTVSYTQGSYIALDPSELNAYNIGLKTNKTLSIQKARALFGSDIAILSVQGKFEDDDTIDYFYDGTDWCTYFVSLGKSNCFINYDAFYEQKSKNSGATYVTKINQTDLINGKLMGGGVPNFRVLIIPDFLYGVYERLKIALGGLDGLKKIKEFYDNGGVIFATGKSGIFLEEINLVQLGTYDRTKLLSVDNNERTTTTVGCESTFNKVYKKEDNDFEKQMTCSTIGQYLKVGLSTTFLTQKLDKNFTTLIDINPKQKDLSITNTNDFITVEINEEEKKILPLISYKSNKKEGYIFLMNFNPMLEGGSRNIAFNLLALSMSKELYLTSKVNLALNSTISDLPIPAGEAGVNLQVKTTIHNLNDEPVTNCKLYVFLPDNFGWTKTPDNCTLNPNTISLPNNVKKKRSVYSSNQLLICNINNIDIYEKRDFIVTISILNYVATQMKFGIQILEPIAVLTSKGKEITLVDYVRVNCEAAPLLRVAANPDPSSFYPVYGEGEYVDNVIKIENKEESNAYEVEYVGLIPVITPLLDGDDQSKTDWALKIYVDYYNKFEFEVPFTSDNATDYVYTAYLQGKGSIIVAEWDSPVLPTKEIISEEMAKQVGDVLKEDVNVTGINRGMITINKTSEVIKQINYRKSNRFYKLASQRLMVFIDDSTPEGAKTLYGENLEKIDKDWKDSISGNTAKREFLFLRNDIYFYDNENYCNPPGVNEKIVFSIDKLVEYKQKADCVKKRGALTERVKPIINGYFDNSSPAHSAKILEPNIYPNELFEYCDLEVIDPTDENAIKKRFGDLEHLRPVHYIIPNVETDLTSALQIYNFECKDGKSGYHKTYPSIKFIYLHSATFTIDAKTCLYGGKIILNLNNLNLNSVDDVTVSPDQIAVFKTEYEKNKISIFFRRGLMSNEQFGKKLSLRINIENLASTQTLTLDMEIQEMIYDISIPEHEKYETVETRKQEFNYITAFSYPALEMKTKLNRDLLGYETKEPFSRYGTYSQDIEHRYIWGTAEAHLQSRPGVVGSTAGFSIISNLGTSSIPFIEYMTVGKGQVIPSGTSTARATWKDIWGRTWHQPIRSLFPDVPPIPPPLKNFMMSTTYEILRGGQQIYEWPSDEKTQIHLHIKLLNNYPKYFEITRCKENEIQFVPRVLSENHDREFANSSSVKIEDSEIKNNEKTFLRQGGFASYGICFSDENAIVGGQKVEGELRTQIERAKVCADFTDENMIAQCFKELENITTLHKIKEEDKSKYPKWNYSPRVEKYYPKTYIEDDMWDLTHIDYDDNAMDKAYKYHMDNHLPNYDNSIIKPHNTIAIPIYKGLGYSITYDKENNMYYHGTKKFGWWSDDLQNKDDTLVAGQTACNQVSVDKQSSILSWVKGKDLLGNDDGSNKNVKEIIEKRNKNIYVCMYNQKRPQFKKGNTIKYATLNVNQNNIVPVLVDLEKDDPRLTNFNCQQEQIEPDDLRKVEGNLLVTPTSKDYLYFAANLRGQAKEAFNVLMNLENFEKVKYEGMVKVNEGGRFVYWNPANGPNSFLVVDNPVSIINSKRNDIEIINRLFPQNIKTFNSIVYHHYTFRDEKKINQVWPFYSYYANSYGYGDFAISVYVGGIRKSTAVLEIGQTTYARIIIYNNCGFDLKMKPDAIKSDEIDQKAISANDLLEKIVHTIRKPTEYSFLEYVVEEKYKKYLTIVPSDHNIEVAPEFFDFENINVATIRDGFKGEYNLKITVDKSFPPEYAGKPIEIKINLLTSYFENFPGTETDLVKKTYRNYKEIKIPSVYIAIPYTEGDFKGKVLYTSAYANSLDFNIKLTTDWEILGAKYIDNKTLDDMLNSLQNKDSLDEINKKFDELKKNVTYTEKVSGLDKAINFTGIGKDIAQFPIPQEKEQDPDQAEVSIILKTRVKQISKGTNYPLKLVSLKYKDWIGKTKSSDGLKPFLEASGPWVVLSYSKLLVDKLANGTYVPSINQEITHEDEGIMRIYFVLTNYGNGNAYNTTYSILLDSKLTYLDCLGVNFVKSNINEVSHTTELTFDLKSGIPQGQSKGGYIYVRYSKLIESYGALTPDELKGLPTTLQVANQSETNISLTNETTSEVVTQVIRTPIVFKYQNNNLLPYLDLIVSGRRSNPTIEIVPKINTLKNNIEGDILKNITKVDMTEYLEEENKMKQKFQVEYIVKNKINFKNPEDKPIDKEPENKKHVVVYSLSVRVGDKMTQNKLAYIQEDIGISTAEVVLIIISIVLFALAGFFIWAGIKNMKLINNKGGEVLLENQVKSSNLDELLNE